MPFNQDIEDQKIRNAMLMYGSVLVKTEMVGGHLERKLIEGWTSPFLRKQKNKKTRTEFAKYTEVRTEKADNCINSKVMEAWIPNKSPNPMRVWADLWKRK